MARLLILTPSHSTQGGVERVIESLARGLPARGFEVVVGLAQGPRFNRPEVFRAAFPALETVAFDYGTGTRTGRVQGVLRAIEQTRPALVLAARLFDGYAATALAKQRRPELRLAVTVQAYEPEYVADLARFQGFVDLCVTSGRLVARAVGRFTDLPAPRVASIPGGVAPATRAVVHDATRPLRLGYVGRLELGQKRILDLPETLAQLDTLGVPWTCRVAGGGPAEAALRRRLAELGLASRVELLGWCEPTRLYEAVYPELDVLLHFAAFEGITIAPREAMAHGVVPVVSRFVGCLSEGQFLDGRNALTFPVADVTAAAQAVARLHGERGLLDDVSAAARRSQGGMSSQEGALDAWAAAFEQALRLPPRSGPRLPELPPPSGRLARLGLPERWAEGLRRFLGREATHAEAGSEWPHHSGLAAPQELARIQAFAAEAERGL